MISLKQRLPRRVVNLLRVTRHVTYVSLAPFDYLYRSLNCKANFPPLHLRRHVGALRTFETSGAEFMGHLRRLVDMKPSEHILDIGCGCGLIAFFLQDYLDDNGRYVGVDLHRPSIKWCQRHFGGNKNFRFDHIDIKSLAHNTRGKFSGATVVFPYDANSFDIVLLKSVFTHLTPTEVENYFREIARLLKEKGRCLATFFLLNQEQETLATGRRDLLKFNFGGEHWRYVYEHSPESASAYDEKYILGLLEQHGLRLREPVYYGTWSGRTTGLSFQDILIIEREHKHT